ncbi:MAG: NosD domain-containing protein [Candidatus Odinarchaeota archaeon]
MKLHIKRKTIILTIFGVIFAFSIQFYYSLTFITEIDEKGLDKRSDNTFDDRNLAISGISDRIHIKNNWSEAKSVGIVTGFGTYSDPYVIEDFIIDGNFLGYCIWIENSNYFLRIENCTVYNSGSISENYWHWRDGIESWWLGGGGIVLSNVSNALIINNNVSKNYRGILLETSNNDTLSGNIVNNNDNYGIDLIDSYNNTLTGNIMDKHGLFITVSTFPVILEHWNSLKIDNTNLVNGKPIYYYINEKNLNVNNFSNAGQVFLINCSESNILNLNMSYTSITITLILSNNNVISGNIINNNSIGITLCESDYNNITGNRIDDNLVGIYLIQSDNNTITTNTVDNNKLQGIGLEMSSNSSIYRNNVSYNMLAGIHVFVSDNNIISENNASYNGGNGINGFVSDNNIISENNASYNGGNGIHGFGGDNNIISENNASYNGGEGIQLSEGNNNRISENIANGNHASGIYLSYCNNNNISENIANGNHASGIYFSYCNNNNVSGNTANNNYINTYGSWVNGIHLYQSDNNIISGNIANNNTNGIFLEYSDNNYISGNAAYHNKLNYFYFGTGIFLLYSEANNISGNTLNNNIGGINSERSAYNSYVNNTISDSNYFGIVITYRGHNAISGNLIKNNTLVGIGLLNSGYNNISGNVANYHDLAGIALQDSDNNLISGNTVDKNMWVGIALNVSKYNSIVGNIVSNNEIGIYLEFSCYNNLSGNIFMNNTVADYYEENNDSCKKRNPSFNLFFLIGILAGVAVIFVGSLSAVSIIQRKKPKEGKRKKLSRFKFKERIAKIRSKSEIKTKPFKINREKVLHGKTLRVYWYILTHNHAGVREIQKSLNLSSPGTVSYQIDKLLKAGIVSKNDKNGKYQVNEELKNGILGFYTHLGFLMIPRFSLYLIVNILGFLGYLVLASIYGDNFISNPGSILLLIFLIFGTTVFIFESIKIWKTRPSS